MTKICPKCNTENTNAAGFCQICGTQLGEANEDKPSGEGLTGWWNKQGNGAKGAIGIVGICCIGLILIVAIGGMFSPDKTTTTPPQTTPTPAQTTPTPVQTTTTPPQTTQSSSGSVQVLSSSSRRDSIGDFIISGEVKNNYNTPVTYAQIVGTGYDSSGHVVASHTTYSDLDTIPAGGTSPFECYLDDPNNQIVRYQLQTQS